MQLFYQHDIFTYIAIKQIFRKTISFKKKQFIYTYTCIYIYTYL